MSRSSQFWTRETIERRRGLHARIDVVALTAPAAAARLRLELYTLTHEVETGSLHGDALRERLGALEADPAFAARAA